MASQRTKNSDEWVSQNLQRQRKILEEKQRQRRLQNSGIYASNNANKSLLSNNGGGDAYGYGFYALPRSSSSVSFANGPNTAGGVTSVSNGSSNSTHSNFTSMSMSQSSSSISQSRGSTAGGGGDTAASTSTIRNSLYSLVDPNRSSNDNTTPNGADSYSSPKIITVKGFTPPMAHKQQRGGQQFPSSSQNIDRLEQLTLAGSTSLNNFDKDDDRTAQRTQLNRMNANASSSNGNTFDSSSSGTTGWHDHLLKTRRRREPWEELEEEQMRKNRHDVDGGVGGGAATVLSFSSTATMLLSSAAAHPPSADDTESIPTEVVNEEHPIGVADIVNNLDHFVMEPTRKNVTLKCKIVRDKKGVDKGMFPIYYLHLEKSDGRRIFLLAARRRKKSATANYLISTDPTDLSRNGRSFIAKIRSNAVGTAFTIYDNGENPKKASVIGEGVRQELAAVIYETNVLGLKGPRKMTIIIPGIYVDEKHNYIRPMTIRPISEKDTILERYKAHRLEEMVVLNNKQPVWSEESQSYVLNFHGRVTQASVKNFQIVHSLSASDTNSAQSDSQFIAEQNEYIVMQFGRIDNNNFTMDVRYPLSPVQAFGIAMTSFHKKLACD